MGQLPRTAHGVCLLLWKHQRGSRFELAGLDRSRGGNTLGRKLKVVGTLRVPLYLKKVIAGMGKDGAITKNGTRSVPATLETPKG